MTLEISVYSCDLWAVSNVPGVVPEYRNFQWLESRRAISSGYWKRDPTVGEVNDERADKNKLIRSSAAGFLTYQASDGEVRVDCLLQDETIWLTQKAIAALKGSCF